MTPTGGPVTTHAEFQSLRLTRSLRIRAMARRLALIPLSMSRSIPRTGNWMRILYYHHVFSDEREGFDEHLRYLKAFGDFISMDDAVTAMRDGRAPSGRHFCITFDDGFKNCVEHALPLLLKHKAPAAFFLPTRYINTSSERDRELLLQFFGDGRTLIEFLSWQDCREMVSAGMSIGAHTVTHVGLKQLTAAQVEWEMRESKEEIERQLGIPCIHFATPFGIPGTTFLENRDPAIAKKVGFASFATTRRGSPLRLSNPFNIDRDHVIAADPTSHLRYFLGT